MVRAHSIARHRNAGTAGVLLAFALIFAQLGAITHLYSHVRMGGDATGLAAKISHVCPDCQSFAPVLGNAGASTHTVAMASTQGATRYLLPLAPRFARAPLTAFRSRAPPLLA
jgi:hypothetical protein